jgi:hypothetical protein
MQDQLAHCRQVIRVRLRIMVKFLIRGERKRQAMLAMLPEGKPLEDILTLVEAAANAW